MTRLEEVQNLLMDGEFESGLDYFTIHDYLRDLKASHDVLLKVYKSHADFCDDDRCRSCETERTIIKAAEGLK